MHQGISRFRKLAVAAVATVATTAGLLPLAAVNAGAAANFDLTRFAGADRFDTAAKISQGTFTAATDVIVTTGDNFPDALAGNYLAGTKSAPILLTHKDSVPATTQAEIARLNPQRVWVLGGTDAVGAGGVPSSSGTVTRVAGATRYETAVAAGSTGTVGSVGGLATAIIATGDKFADALSAGPGAYAGNFPLYLTPGSPATALNASTKAALTARGIKHVILMGGTAAVSAAVETEIQGMGITTERAQGADRTETARVFAEWLLTNLGFSNAHMNVARGDLFPDALAGGPHAGREKGPILLTWTSTAATADGGSTTGVLKYATDHKASLTGGHIFGGTAAVSDAVETAIETAGGRVGAVSGATSRPDLVSAAIVQTTTAANATPTNPAGTVVRYVFDESVTGGAPVPGNFLVYNADGTVANIAGAVAAVDATTNNAVNVLFPNLNTAASAATLTLATVDFGAVFGTAGANDQNPEGDAAIGTAQSAGAAAGATAAPDLLSVASRGAAAPAFPNSSVVDFTFDAAATTLLPAGFHLVLTTAGSGGEVVNCTGPAVGSPTAGGGTSPGGNGTTTLTVVCPNSTATPTAAITTAQIARGYVDLGTVATTTAAATQNPIEASNTPHGNSPGPELISATLAPAANPANVDQVIYTFDEPVACTPVGAGNAAFHVYGQGGAATQVNSVNCVSNPGNNTQVLVDFAAGTAVDTAVGASIDAGAVTATSGVPPARPNRVDEVGVTNNTIGAQQPGSTAGPDLTGVALSTSTDALGNQSFRAVYVYDENITAAGIVPTDHFLYLADGTQLTCQTAVQGTAAGSGVGTQTGLNTVVCTAFNVTTGPGVPFAATSAQIGSAKLGTVNDTAVVAADGGPANPEGAAATTGGTA
jgi:putative cell wall-binding protein